MVTRDGDTSTITLSGELDMTVSADLSRVLTDEVNRPGTTTVQADLAAVDFIDSTVINAFIGAFRTARSNGHSFVVTRARGHVNNVLTVSGVLPTLAIPRTTTH